MLESGFEVYRIEDIIIWIVVNVGELESVCYMMVIGIFVGFCFSNYM